MSSRGDLRLNGFRIVTAAVSGILLALLLWGLRHESASAALLGRFSVGYAILLGALLLLLLVCLWALWKRPARLVQALSNLYLMVGSLAASLLLLEMGLRVVNPWGMDFFHWLPYHMQGMVDHPDLGYVHPRSVSYRLGKNFVTLNAHGLRDKEMAYGKPGGERRVLLLGDSVTFGWGVSDGESFADQMEPLLRARTGHPWEVINAGVNGYNTQQSAKYFLAEGVRYQPDIVILTFVDNDLDAVLDPNVTTWRRYPTWPASLPEALDRLRYLSYTFQATQMFLRAQKLGAQRAGVVEDSSAQGLTRDPRWRDVRGHLDAIARVCRDNDIAFMVAKFGPAEPDFVSEVESLGIPVVPLSDALAAVPPAEAYVSKVDPHPSAASHRRIAALLVNQVDRRIMSD